MILLYPFFPPEMLSRQIAVHMAPDVLSFVSRVQITGGYSPENSSPFSYAVESLGS
jgi:hypothetical protein